MTRPLFAPHFSHPSPFLHPSYPDCSPVDRKGVNPLLFLTFLTRQKNDLWRKLLSQPSFHKLSCYQFIFPTDFYTYLLFLFGFVWEVRRSVKNLRSLDASCAAQRLLGNRLSWLRCKQKVVISDTFSSFLWHRQLLRMNSEPRIEEAGIL